MYLKVSCILFVKHMGTIAVLPMASLSPRKRPHESMDIAGDGKLHDSFSMKGLGAETDENENIPFCDEQPQSDLRSPPPLSNLSTPTLTSSILTPSTNFNSSPIKMDKTKVDETAAPSAKRRKLTAAEKAVRDAEKQAEAQRKAEQKARREQEKKDKEEQKKSQQAEREQVRQEKEREKEEKKKAKEAKELEKEENKKKKETEKKAKEDEKTMKDKVSREISGCSY